MTMGTGRVLTGVGLARGPAASVGALLPHTGTPPRGQGAPPQLPRPRAGGLTSAVADEPPDGPRHEGLQRSPPPGAARSHGVRDGRPGAGAPLIRDRAARGA